jgi:hypothetical protein
MMAMDGDIMEISGLGQPDAVYTSFLQVKLTKNGKPVKGVVEFYDEDLKKLSTKQTDANGLVLETFKVPKITRIYVTSAGMVDVKTMPGMTTDNAAEAKTDQNTVFYEIPASGAAGAGGGQTIAAFWDGMSTMEKALLVGGSLALVGLIVIIAMNKKSSPVMEGVSALAGWCGIGNEDCD